MIEEKLISPLLSLV